MAELEWLELPVGAGPVLKYPHMREELLSHLWDLADRQRLLLDSDKGSLLGYAVHYLFDDTPLGEDPSRAVGWFLHDEAEARLVGTVATALDRVFEEHGTESGVPLPPKSKTPEAFAQGSL